MGVLYANVGGSWIEVTGATTLDGLTDVDATSPADNQALTWDAGSNRWVPETIASGGTDLLEYLADEDTFTRADVVNGPIGKTEKWARFWEVGTGWSITSGQLHRVSGYGIQVTHSHTSANKIEVTVAAGATAEWYLIWRILDSTNYARFGVNGGVYYKDVVTASNIRAPEVLFPVNTPPTPANGDRVAVYTYDDDGFDLYVNDVHLWTGGDTQGVANRSVGVAANGATAKFDNFKVTPTPGGITKLHWLENVNAPTPTDGQALVWSASTSKWIAGTVSGGGAQTMGFVNHGSTAGTARPTGYGAITWRGSVEPTNMLNDVDLWVDTTP